MTQANNACDAAEGSTPGDQAAAVANYRRLANLITEAEGGALSADQPTVDALNADLSNRINQPLNTAGQLTSATDSLAAAITLIKAVLRV
jgi:hypothetical protein